MTGSIYFARCPVASAIKIGYTTGDPAARLRQLDTTGTPGPLELVFALSGTQADEQALHAKFASDRIRDNREWFRESSALADFIASRRRERQDQDSQVAHFVGFANAAGWRIHPNAASQPCLRDVRRISGQVGAALVDAYRLHLQLMDMAYEKAREDALDSMMAAIDELEKEAA